MNVRVEEDRKHGIKRFVVNCECGRTIVIPIMEPPSPIRELYEVEEMIKRRLNDEKENNELQDRRGEAKTD